MQLTHTITKKIICLSVYTLLLFLCSGCASKDGQQDTEILEETAEEATKATTENGTVEKIDRDAVGETDERQYPVLLTPTRTKNIAFAIESENIFCICNGEKYGYLKKTGEEITYYTYDTAYPFSEGLACVMVDGKYGFINENGEEAIPFIYEDAAPFQDGLAYFATEEEYGFMDKDGTPVFYLDCDSISSFKEGFAYFSIDGRYGYLDKTGQVAIDAEFSDADYFKDGLAFVEIDGYKGAVNAKGEIVIPVQYDSIRREDGYIFAISGDETEYYSLTGDVIPQEVYANQVNTENEDDEYMHLQEELDGIYDDVVFFEDGSYCLKEGEDTFLYNTEQELIYENHGVDGTVSISWLEYGYKIEDDDTIFLIDKCGKEIITAACDYASHDIYSDYKNSILKQYDSDTPDRILLLEKNDETDISDVLLKNSITPKIELYWKLTNGKPMDILNTENEVVNVKKFATWGESDYRKTAKLYDVLQNGRSLLYCMEEPAIQQSFPLSDSALYGIKDNQLQCLVSGEECGGSLRGDYVCFFKDMESGKNLIGNQGSAGGFGGIATYGRIYDYETGNANLIFSYEWIMQSAGNYAEEDLYNNAHLFYDENDNPYTQDAIWDAETVREYLVNEERVSKEIYENACERYRCFTLFE